jgi:Nucleotidyl transferase AbiEii toxin, Type IV TA system
MRSSCSLMETECRSRWRSTSSSEAPYCAQRSLIPTAQELFTTDITLPVLDTADLYGGKLVAAMDRQHPRDIFDVLKMTEQFGRQPAFVDCFVAYLAGHNRPVHEGLFPKTLPLKPAFTSEFSGMTRDEVTLNSARKPPRG